MGINRTRDVQVKKIVSRRLVRSERTENGWIGAGEVECWRVKEVEGIVVDNVVWVISFQTRTNRS
jgi:hypothetical protein